MTRTRSAAMLPWRMSALVATYFLASLAHFAHNAEFIAFYPGMPAWITRETVYLAWLGVTSIGVVAFALLGFGATTAAYLSLGVYGALGLDGLAHYTLALCSEHTVLANVTIWAEAIAGFLLLVVSWSVVGRRMARRRDPTR